MKVSGFSEKEVLVKALRITAILAAVLTSALSFSILSRGYGVLESLPSLQSGHDDKVSVSTSSSAASSGHGAPPGQGVKATEDTSVIGLDEMVMNLQSEEEPDKLFSLGMKLELQLFDDADFKEIQRAIGPVRNTILEATRSQNYNHLKTTAGKLYFKELLVARINQLFNASAVRDVRFSALIFQR